MTLKNHYRHVSLPLLEDVSQVAVTQWGALLEQHETAG